MSILSSADLSVVSALVDYLRGPGYVLDFSDRTFSQFFASEFDIDIDDPRYADTGGSKGKRLRRLLQLADDSMAAAVLQAIWDERKALLDNGPDPVAGGERRYQALLAKLLKGPQPPPPPPPFNHAMHDRLKEQILALSPMQPQQRGYAFERFLTGLFEIQGLDPRKSFRNRGEEIDGSFVLGGHSYLLEAKWQALETGATHLHSFEGKLGEKAPWARGLFVSYVGFSEDGLVAFGRAKRTVCMDGYDLFEMLDRKLSLNQVLEAKVRRAAETGRPFVRVRDLF